MPRANAQHSRTHFHRQGRAHRSLAARRLLERGMPYRGPRVERQPTLEVLGCAAMTNQCRNPNDEASAVAYFNLWAFICKWCLPTGSRRHSRLTTCATTLAGCIILLAVVEVSAAEVDVLRLPPAATNVISFDQQVRPILDRSCI